MLVLLVDDSVPVAEMLRNVLEAHGHSVTIARSFAAGRAALDNSFDLVISDLELRDGSGDELCALAKTVAPRTHTILLSGGFADQDAAERFAATHPALDVAYAKGASPVIETLLAGIAQLGPTAS